MRLCSICEKGAWQGAKKNGKFVCSVCLGKEIEKKKEPEKAEEGEDK